MVTLWYNYLCLKRVETIYLGNIQTKEKDPRHKSRVFFFYQRLRMNKSSFVTFRICPERQTPEKGK